MRTGDHGVPDINDWLISNLKKGESVGIDPMLLSVSYVKTMQKKLEPFDISVYLFPYNPIDKIWGLNKPNAPCLPIKIHDIKYAGVTYQDKIKDVQDYLAKNDAYAIVITMLDEVYI